MKVISIDEFYKALGETVSSSDPTYDKIIDVLVSCKQYEFDDELLDALNVLKRYFNEGD